MFLEKPCFPSGLMKIKFKIEIKPPEFKHEYLAECEEENTNNLILIKKK